MVLGDPSSAQCEEPFSDRRTVQCKEEPHHWGRETTPLRPAFQHSMQLLSSTKGSSLRLCRPCTSIQKVDMIDAPSHPPKPEVVEAPASVDSSNLSHLSTRIVPCKASASNSQGCWQGVFVDVWRGCYTNLKMDRMFGRRLSLTVNLRRFPLENLTTYHSHYAECHTPNVRLDGCRVARVERVEGWAPGGQRTCRRAEEFNVFQTCHDLFERLGPIKRVSYRVLL